MSLFQAPTWYSGLLILAFIISKSAVADLQSDEVSPEDLQDLLQNAKEAEESNRHECPLLPMRISPAPLQAGQQSGWVLVIFDISGTGKVMNEQVIDSNLAREEQLEALELIRTFQFAPVSRNNRGFVFENWVERIDFLPADGGPDPAWPNPKKYFETECNS